jgi:hypothetical protein
MTTALWQWQKLSVLLLQEESSQQNTPEPSDAIQPQVSKLKTALDLVLSSFAPASHEERYRQSEQLEDLILAGAKLGYLLLSHPCRWSFDWHTDDHEMILLPGLLKVGNASGEMLDLPRRVGPRGL